LQGDAGGHWYLSKLDDMQGLLSPALFKYFEVALPELYARADELS
jgi:hypothetical protein